MSEKELLEKKLRNKKDLLEVLPFATNVLKSDRFQIKKMEEVLPSKNIVAEVLLNAEAYPQFFNFDNLCIYGRYYEEYGRYFLGIVPLEVTKNPEILPFTTDSSFCYGVVWSEKGDLDLHLVHTGKEKIIGVGEDITREDTKAFATFISVITQ